MQPLNGDCVKVKLGFLKNSESGLTESQTAFKLNNSMGCLLKNLSILKMNSLIKKKN